ncbi:MAG: hypothetical protein JNM66_03975 [Bryobacterales bacterium]|nr:hypothetical protein [Bryobacterales bacterium]
MGLRRNKKIGYGILCAAVIAWAGVRTGQWMRGGRKQPDKVLPNPLLLLALLGASFVVLAVHELGHLAGAALGGYEFQFLTVGPFTLCRENGRIRFRWNTDWTKMGGLAAALPGPGADVRKGAMLMVIGGPLASGALAAVAGVLYVLGSGGWKFWGLSVCLLSLVIGVVTSVPTAMGEYLSDGARFLQLLRGGMEANRWLAMAAFSAQNQAGVRPRNWALDEAKPEWVDASPDGMMTASALYFRELDRGETEAAGEWLDRSLECLTAAPEFFRVAAVLEAAWFEGAVRGRAAVAREWLERAESTALMPRWCRLRTEAAVLAAEGNVEEAVEKRTEALRLLADAPVSGATALLREQLAVVP